jgi:CheY-like chemotaxis protein
LAGHRLDVFVERNRDLLRLQIEFATRGHSVKTETVLRPRERAPRGAIISIERSDPSGSIAELAWHIELGPSLARPKSGRAATPEYPACHRELRSVLLVDDNADTLELVGHTLRTEGLDVVTATRARQALGILDAPTRPGIIVTDLLMPGLSGWDFIREVRATRAYNAIPIVVISAVASPDLAVDSVAAVFRKPLNPLELAHALRDMMSAPPTTTAGGECRRPE